MRVPEGIRSSLRDNRVVLFGLSVALFVVTLAYYAVLRGRGLDTPLVNNQVLLFFLRNVNAVLVTAIVYVLLRNLVKLWIERQRQELGSRFKTKLVATYIGLSLIPVLLLFALAMELVQGSLDTLFSTDEASLLEPGYNVSQALTSELERRALREATALVDAARPFDLDDPGQLPELSRLLQENLRRHQLDVIYLYEETEFLHALISPQSGLARLPDLARDFLLEALRDGSATRVAEPPGESSRLVLAAVAGEPKESSRRSISVTGIVLAADLAEQTQMLVDARQERRQLEVLEPQIRSIYLLSFLTVTLVLLLICTWAGLLLARRITVPIQELAEGTRHIMSGDLQYRVPETADDELGVLIGSFNRMTEELQRSNSKLLASHRELDDERAWIGTVLEHVAAGVISINEQHEVQTCNSAATEMLGVSAESLLEHTLPAAVEEEPALYALFKEALQLGPGAHRQVRLVLAGHWKTFDVTASPIRDPISGSSGRVLVLEDLTELIRAQELATWNDAARRIAHEIKNPLTPIKLAAERLSKRYHDHDDKFGETLDRSVQIIVREVGNMKSMVDEFAQFAKMPRPQPTTVDLKRLLEDTVVLYREIKPGLVVAAATESSARQASVDAEQMRRALVNLLDNAVEATPSPGRVEVRASRSNGSLRIEVADTGSGIPTDAKEKLFLPYYSTKGRGTGLGLAIVHRIVTEHHGTIRVSDNQPHGTVFTLELPQVSS